MRGLTSVFVVAISYLFSSNTCVIWEAEGVNVENRWAKFGNYLGGKRGMRMQEHV